MPEVWYSLGRALKQTATVFTHRKPTQEHRLGERLEGLPGSSGRGRHGEQRRELGRPWRCLRPQGAGQPLRPEGGRLKTFRESDQLIVLRDKAFEVRRKELTA
jgi:hypothetical protein